MIEDPPLVTLKRGWTRPSAEQVDAFRGAQTGHVADALGGRGALDYRINPVDPDNAVFCGAVLTVQVSSSDMLAIHAVFDVAQAGDVVVCAADGNRETAVIGDLVAGILRNNGVAAFVTDGLVRDSAGIVAARLPCFAAGISPNSPAATGPGSVGLPIVIGGVAAKPGDIALGDRDGVAIVPAAAITDTISALERVRVAEREQEAAVAAGLRQTAKGATLARSGKIALID